ncbi:hypothetical protein M0R72_10280 [Candidatus Pacearchaeota archaeon]|jgi:hypothetical protein|nr:hypothetical protein [Candidatus Pacearchaeota archaeon]
MSKEFNGSTLLFAGVTVGSLRGITFDKTYPKADVTGSSDTDATEVPGIPTTEVSCDIVGGTLPTATMGSLGVTWKDTTTSGTLSTAGICGVNLKGTMNGEMTGTIKFCKMP